METKDHFFLARRLSAAMKLKPLCRAAFIFGNIFPDFNPLSYLIRCGNNRLGGHNYITRKTLIQSIGPLKHPRSLWAWFAAGEKMHYLADAFTRPHNHEFECPSKDHVDYERQLHQHLLSRFSKGLSRQSPKLPRDFPRWLPAVHRRYIQSNPGIREDCAYIIHVCQIAAKIMLRPVCSAAGTF